MKFSIPEEHKGASGVYVIRNTVNEKVYVGSAISLWKRFGSHRRHLERNVHRSSRLQHSFNKHGPDKFFVELLELTPPEKTALLTCEQKWIDHYQCFLREKGFNSYPAAGSPLGVKRSDETKAKMSRAKKGHIKSPETRARISQAQKGRTPPAISEEGRRRISESNLRRLKDPDTDAQRREALKSNYMIYGNPRKGRRLSDETKRKISEAATGRKLPEAQIQKMRERVVSSETRERLSVAGRGKKMPEEAKQRLSEVARDKWSKIAPEARKLSPETIAKRQATREARIAAGAYKQKVYTDEQRAGLSERRKEYWRKVKAGELPVPRKRAKAV